MFDGIEKPMPILPPTRPPDKICELIPISSPLRLTSAPPEFPRLIGASVCRKSSKLPSLKPVLPAFSRNYAGRYGLPDAERIADRENDVTDANTIRIAEVKKGKVFRLDLEDRQIAGLVRADDFCVI